MSYKKCYNEQNETKFDKRIRKLITILKIVYQVINQWMFNSFNKTTTINVTIILT